MYNYFVNKILKILNLNGFKCVYIVKSILKGIIIMFCENCGRKINDEARFCRFCGMPVMDALEKDPPAKPVAEKKLICKNCGAELIEDSLFCDMCGHSIDKEVSNKTCKICGFEIEEDSSFCSMCGAKL